MNEYSYTQTYNAERKKEELTFIIPKADFEKFGQKALAEVSAKTTLPGFRKGKAPENQILKYKYNEISEKAINIAIDAALKSIENLEPRPLEMLEVSNFNLEENGDLKLILSYIPMPTVEVGDLSKIKVTEKEAKKTDSEELNNELKNLWHFYAKKLDPEVKKEDFSEDKINEDFFEKSGIAADYPDIKTIDDLKKFLEEYINTTYESQAKSSWENEVIDAVIKTTKYEKVEGLIEKELDKRVENYKSRFTAIGMNAEEYMEKNNLKEDELRKEWAETAERDVKLEIMLQKYAEANEIKPTDEEIDDQVQNLDDNVKNTYKNDPEYMRSLVRYYSINQKAYQDIIEKVRSNIAPKQKAKK